VAPILTLGSSYALEKESVTRAIGIHLLRTQARAPVAISDFHSLWKDATTIVADWPRDLSQLVGTYVCPQPDTIRYLDRATLSAEPKTRFQQLLSIKSSWDLDDIAPFIEDVAHHGVKLENFILKYARKKRAGSRIIVTQR
jgi:sister chromatid cohesion protein DCC1